MVSIPGCENTVIGSPPGERDRQSIENQHRKRIDRTFAIATKEVTVGQFHKFLDDSPEIQHKYNHVRAPTEDCPQISVTWYEAAAYCRWLSEQEGVPENQMCYPPVEKIQVGMTMPSDYLARTGYRLPTEAEWEYACRSGSQTSRCYGQAESLLDQYAWYAANSEDRSWPVGSLKPNSWGLFDMHGNVQEWCQDGYYDYTRYLGAISSDVEDLSTAEDSTRRILRGGSFGMRSSNVRSAYRNYNRLSNRYDNSGFRIARTITGHTTN